MSTPPPPKNNNTCYNCGGEGHHSINCKTRPQRLTRCPTCLSVNGHLPDCFNQRFRSVPIHLARQIPLQQMNQIATLRFVLHGNALFTVENNVRRLITGQRGNLPLAEVNAIAIFQNRESITFMGHATSTIFVNIRTLNNIVARLCISMGICVLNSRVTMHSNGIVSYNVRDRSVTQGPSNVDFLVDAPRLEWRVVIDFAHTAFVLSVENGQLARLRDGSFTSPPRQKLLDRPVQPLPGLPALDDEVNRNDEQSSVTPRGKQQHNAEIVKPKNENNNNSFENANPLQNCKNLHALSDELDHNVEQNIDFSDEEGAIGGVTSSESTIDSMINDDDDSINVGPMPFPYGYDVQAARAYMDVALLVQRQNSSDEKLNEDSK